MKWTKLIDGHLFRIRVKKDSSNQWYVFCDYKDDNGIHVSIAPLPKPKMTESEIEEMLFEPKWLNNTDSYSTNPCC